MLPPLSPILMPGRIALAAAPAWQVALSIAFMVATIAVLARVGTVVYRNAVLHLGPRLRLRDVLR